jgi:heme/copper-type cytochrome/quinol oxidase subunit 2
MQKSISIEEKNAYFLLINRYSDKLDKTEGKLRKLEAHLANAKSQQITQWITLIIFGIMLIILVAFVLYYIVFKDKR